MVESFRQVVRLLLGRINPFRMAHGVSMHAINKGPKYLQAHYGNNLINLKQYANGSTKHDDDDDEVV